MECSLTRIITLIIGAIALLFMAIALASAAIVPAALAVVLIVYALLPFINRAFNQYRTCRDAAERPSACSTNSIINHFAALAVLLGIATTGLALIILAGWIPAIGQIIGVGSTVATVVAMGLAIVILLSLMAFLVMYRDCRNAEVQALDRNPVGGDRIVGGNPPVLGTQD